MKRTDHRAVSRAGLARMAALALLWGSGFLWIKLALRGFNPVQIVFARLLLGFVVLAPLVLSRGLGFPRGWRVWGHLFVAALVANAIPYVLFGIGEQTVGSNVAGVLNATTPLWTLLLAFLVGVDRSVTWRKGAGFALGFLGVVVIFSPWESANEIASWGGLACLAAAASYGVSYVYMGRYLAGRGISPIVLSASQLGAATVLLALAMPFAGLEPPVWRADAVLSLLVLGVLGTGLAYVLNYRIISDEGATAASVVTYLLPIVAVMLGWIVVDEPVTGAILAGVGLVLVGVVLTRRRTAR
ncbi:DMT family transporter [Micromonospora cathayae]|uniref:DMT family transporter n=1 Tax=Micromonospora cathayae TaxID=3028804 RepID=A0ABY7ZSM7_9ACTN|nr:DMT family transporter [Micromonospora sp. HUAS 3]WDZ85391.1 DMT family transporter [Micromonospora sp. HUAS 3]